jgi:hypothetical protein
MLEAWLMQILGFSISGKRKLLLANIYDRVIDKEI